MEYRSHPSILERYQQIGMVRGNRVRNNRRKGVIVLKVKHWNYLPILNTVRRDMKVYMDPVFMPRVLRIKPIDTTNTQDNKEQTNEQSKQRQRNKRVDGRYI